VPHRQGRFITRRVIPAIGLVILLLSAAALLAMVSGFAAMADARQQVPSGDEIQIPADGVTPLDPDEGTGEILIAQQ
jgi:uncharacterized membrane protein YdfJ with MMPL/SSD domain